jgi:undecaprenyl-diphosphatase
MGSPVRRISADFLAKKIRNQGLEDLTLKPASVDARGSVPFFGEAKGKKVFVKVFNQDNNAADWLFKLVRRIQYRRLEDEVPSLTPKRAIEHEAYLTMLAKYNAKARVPEVLGIYRVGANSYAMATEMIDSTGLDKMELKDISDKTLDDIWVQIKRLHQHNIIHKDLRAANVMVQSRTGMPWIIDFGFSECAVQPKSFYKDNVEFIASSATKVRAWASDF